MKHLKQETVSGAQLNMDALYQICPQCFTESKDSKTGEIHRSVDFDKLRLLLGDNIAQGDERYEFTWVGKRAALQEAAKPIRKTLRPCPEESVDWENTKNLYIEGDNLEVLKLEVLKLLQNSYMGKVKMIYIDPPYNTGNDFVYHDDFHQSKQDYDLFAGDVNEEGERLIRNTGSNGRFHSDWCSMIYSRLMLARTLLTEDGVIFVSIDDNELKNLENICNELSKMPDIVPLFEYIEKMEDEQEAKGYIVEPRNVLAKPHVETAEEAAQRIMKIIKQDIIDPIVSGKFVQPSYMAEFEQIWKDILTDEELLGLMRKEEFGESYNLKLVLNILALMTYKSTVLSASNNKLNTTLFSGGNGHPKYFSINIGDTYSAFTSSIQQANVKSIIAKHKK